MKKLLWILISAVFVSTSLLSQSLEIDQLLADYKLTLPKHAEVSIAVINNNQAQYYGYQMIDEKAVEVNNQDRIFEIGSITKTFTGALLMQQIKNQKVDINASILEYLKQEGIQNDALQDVKIKHLLTHTSGLSTGPEGFVLPYLRGALFARKNPHKFMKWQHYHKYLTNAVLDTVPGVVWNYNNAGIGLMGKILALNESSSWEKQLDDKLLKPLEMTNTFATSEGAPEGQYVQGYDRSGKPSKYWDMDFINPAGSMKSTAQDMVKWINAHLNAEDCSAFADMKLSHDEIKISEKSGNMGNIWWHHNGITYHGGATGAFRAFAAMNDENKTGVVVLINYNAHHPKVRNSDGSSIQRKLGFDIMEALKKTVSVSN